MQQSYHSNAYTNGYNDPHAQARSPIQPQNGFNSQRPAMNENAPAFRGQSPAAHRAPGTGYNSPHGYGGYAAPQSPGPNAGFAAPNPAYSSNSRPTSPGYRGPSPMQNAPLKLQTAPPAGGYYAQPVTPEIDSPSRYNPPSFGADEPEPPIVPIHALDSQPPFPLNNAGYPAPVMNTMNNMNNMNMPFTAPPEKVYQPRERSGSTASQFDQSRPQAPRGRSDSTIVQYQQRPQQAPRTRSDSTTSQYNNPRPHVPRSRAGSAGSRSDRPHTSRSRSGSASSHRGNRSRSASASSAQQNFSRPGSVMRSATMPANPKNPSPLAQAHTSKDMSRLEPQGDQSLVRDPAFWKRFSTAVHLADLEKDEEKGVVPTSSQSSTVDLKHADSWLKQQEKEKKRIRRNCWAIGLLVCILVAAVIFVLYYFLKMRK